MDDRDRAYCEQAIADGQKALEHYGRAGKAWASDDMAADAIVKRIESFCEYVSRISDPQQARHPEFPWRQIHGIRNRLAHDYHRTNVAVVQEVLDVHLPRGLDAIRGWLADAKPRDLT